MSAFDRTIDPRPGGMGDAVLALWITEGARACGDDVRFVAGAYEPIIRAFGHRLTPLPSEDCMGLGAGTNTFNDEFSSSHLDRTLRTERWQRTVGWNYPAKRPKLVEIDAEGAAWASELHGAKPKVVIAPRAHVGNRCLPVQKWIRVARALEAEGIETIAIDGYKENLQGFPLYAYGFAWSHLLPLLQGARLVAGNDSGVAHLSSTIGIRTVVALGPTDPDVVFGHCTDVVSTISNRRVECTNCHYHVEGGYHAVCNIGCESLDRLPWNHVFEAVMSAVLRTDAPPQTVGVLC